MAFGRDSWKSDTFYLLQGEASEGENLLLWALGRVPYPSDRLN